MKPHDVFISHVEEDRDLTEAIAAELESTGCGVWYYERDGLPGTSYLSQTREAIDASRCLLFLVSASALERPHQVDKELVRAHETAKHVIPILRDISFRHFRTSRPDWHQAIGAVVGIELTATTIAQALQRLTMGLRAIGIVPPEGPTAAREASVDAPLEDAVHDDFEAETDEETVPSLASDDGHFDAGPRGLQDFIRATFVHEHRSTGKPWIRSGKRKYCTGSGRGPILNTTMRGWGPSRRCEKPTQREVGHSSSPSVTMASARKPVLRRIARSMALPQRSSG
ncbi:MAG: toll/interleukin-1 receptor domain-containing protein [Planctomycetia bacterium]